MGKYNKDVRSGKISGTSNKKGLEDVILQQHGRDPPDIHDHNTNNVPIDRIFGSASFSILTRGYLRFKEAFESDCQTL